MYNHTYVNVMAHFAIVDPFCDVFAAVEEHSSSYTTSCMWSLWSASCYHCQTVSRVLSAWQTVIRPRLGSLSYKRSCGKQEGTQRNFLQSIWRLSKGSYQKSLMCWQALEFFVNKTVLELFVIPSLRNSRLTKHSTGHTCVHLMWQADQSLSRCCIQTTITG